jgi:hypothetical protein
MAESCSDRLWRSRPDFRGSTEIRGSGRARLRTELVYLTDLIKLEKVRNSEGSGLRRVEDFATSVANVLPGSSFFSMMLRVRYALIDSAEVSRDIFHIECDFSSAPSNSSSFNEGVDEMGCSPGARRRWSISRHRIIAAKRKSLQLSEESNQVSSCKSPPGLVSA